MTERTVPELARETLKQLITRKLAPTPANYRSVFNEIGKLPSDPPFPLEELRKIAQQLPTRTPGQQKQRSLLEYAVSQLNWQGVHDALVAYGSFTPRDSVESSGFGGLNGNGTKAPANRPSGIEVAGVTPVAPALTPDFLQQIARLIEFARPALGNDDARFVEQTNELIASLRDDGADVVQVKKMLSTYTHRVSFAAEDQAEIRSTLLHLLRLIMENVGELSVDDRWLKGQIDALMAAATPPLTLRRLDDVERRLRDVILKQSEAKGRAVEAQEEMRQMLRVFIERLATMTDVHRRLRHRDGAERRPDRAGQEPGRTHAGAQAGGERHAGDCAAIAERARRIAGHARTRAGNRSRAGQTAPGAGPCQYPGPP